MKNPVVPLLSVVLGVGVVAATCSLDLRGGPHPDPELLQASANGDLNRVRDLLNSGVSIESRNENGQTALFRASQFQQRKTFDYLLAHGANIGAVDNSGEGILVRAVRSGNIEWVQYLVSRGAAKNYVAVSKVSGDRVPLHWAAGAGNLEMVKVLLSAGVRPGLLDGDGHSAAQWAERANRTAVADFLKSQVAVDSPTKR